MSLINSCWLLFGEGAWLPWIESQAYDYLPDMASSQDKLNRLFDLETSFTFESSEQAWAALLWALDIENVQPFLKDWKTSRQFAKQVQDLLTILALREKENEQARLLPL